MGATANTIQSDPSPEERGVGTADKDPERNAKNDAPAAWLAAAVGVVLLVLAAPRMAGEIWVVDARTTLYDVLDTRAGDTDSPDPADLTQAAARISLAGALTGDARLIADRGLLLLRRAEAEPPGPQRDQLLADALAATERGLASGPGQTYAWARLAYLRAITGDRRGAGDALRLSMLAGSVAPQLMPSRLRLGLFLLPDLDKEERDLLARQVRLLFIMRPEQLEGIATTDTIRAFIDEALATMTEADIANYIRLRDTDGATGANQP